MTTIAYRDGILAADSAVFDRGVLVARTPDKIWRNPDGSIAGVAGCFGDHALIREWLMGGRKGDAPKFRYENTEGIMVMPDGQIHWFGSEGRTIQQIAPYSAIGSGFAVAMGALYMGATAQQAVEACCELDDSTGLPVHILRLP